MTNKSKIPPFKNWLETVSHRDSITTLRELADRYPEVYQDLTERAKYHLRKKSPKIHLKELHQYLTEASPNTDVNKFSANGYEYVDYSEVIRKMEEMLNLGLNDEILNFGEDFVIQAIDDIYDHDYNGEVFGEAVSVINFFIKTLEQSQKSETDKITWVININLHDTIGFTGDLKDFLEKNNFSSQSWSEVADKLLDKSRENKSKKHDSKFVDWTNIALEKSARYDEIFSLFSTELSMIYPYDLRVKALIDNSHFEQAENLVKAGLRITPSNSTSTVNKLMALWEKILIQRNDWSEVLQLKVLKFVQEPSLDKYKTVMETAYSLKSWPDVRSLLLSYLEKSSLPWDDKKWCWGEADDKDILTHLSQNFNITFPDTENLVEIFIFENDPKIVKKWYEKYEILISCPDENLELKVADAICKDYPEKALDIWKKYAKANIIVAKTSYYRTSIKLIKKIANLLISLDKKAEWELYLNNLRTLYVKNTHFLEFLEEEFKST